ncbi:hypothetical protein EVG20_g971 [Dentipellis fragilis]|uniref:nicotinate phosphoribosyltransferase n=1 Tax=Dentipellis fragilis TaxID=205917 RepID=A0A4Y9ZE41_9AGAM|nr:hypothetical protein EVG20_g971 [Dentipellis fragilis]
MRGYEHANGIAMDLWEAVYHDVLLIALTDTFSTKAFWQDFTADPARARRWRGLRQDSGDPFVFAGEAKEVYERMGIDYREKMIIYSDALNEDKRLRSRSSATPSASTVRPRSPLPAPSTPRGPSFGIGTFLTNDFRSLSSGGKEKSKALNMVIKLASIDDKPCIKISDDLLKNTGDIATVYRVKDIFGLPK